MTDRMFDTVIIGGGLAGATLAWRLRERGLRPLLIDRRDPAAASRAAAGLITPVTGKRLVKTWNWETAWPAARSFYRSVEALTESAFLDARPSVRLFVSEEERTLFQQRCQSVDFAAIVRPLDPRGTEFPFSAPWGGFEMLPGGQLNVPAYLDASRARFLLDDRWLDADWDPQTDFMIDESGVRLPRWNIRAERLILCQGVVSALPPEFDAAAFLPAKGEILKVRIPSLHERRAVHRGVWIAPTVDDRYRVGATFDWEHLDAAPTLQARAQLLTQLLDFLPLPLEVVDQQAAVRPTTKDSFPIVGLHPDEPRLGILNGLGTKGALLAPWLAERLTAAILDGRPLPAEVDAGRCRR